MQSFDAQQLESHLRRLGEVARAQNITIDMVIVGGAAMALGFGTRRSTHDVDMVRATPSLEIVKGLARVVAEERSLGDRWLSADAVMFAPTIADGPVLLDSDGIRVRRVADEQLLAMKLDAMRDDVDRADAIVVATRLGLSRDSAELAIAPYVRTERYRRACDELEEIWDEVRHAPR